MSNPPSTKHKSSSTITMSIDQLQNEQTVTSPNHTFDGKIWRLHVSRTNVGCADPDCYRLKGTIDCDGDGSSEMWRTNAKMRLSWKRKHGNLDNCREVLHTFTSWKGDGNNCELADFLCNFFSERGRNPPTPIEAVVTIETESESFILRPILDPNSDHDVILVLKGRKFPVNKQDLSSQSIYFDRLFNGDFEESKQDKIEIKDTNPKDFDELLKMMYGTSTKHITEVKATRYLIMADFFDLQIVKEKVEKWLLSTLSSSPQSIHRKFLIAEEHKLEILKSEALHLYNNNREHLMSLKKSPEFAEVSDSMKTLLFENARDLLN